MKNIIDIPYEKNYEYDVYYTYTIKAKDRDKLKDYLFNKGIETKIHHPLLMPEQPFYKKGVKGEYKNAKKLIKKVLCLPIHENLNEDDLIYVVQNIKNFYRKK